MADIFLSYASEDRDRATLIAEALQAEGWTVWWDRQVRVGEDFDDAIEDALSGARCVIVLWSRHSTTKRWVKNEAMAGLERGILLPVLLDDVDIPLPFKTTQAADLRNWRGRRGESPLTEALIHSIAEMVGDPRAGATSRGATDRRRREIPKSVLVASVIFLAAMSAWLLNRTPAPNEGSRPYVVVVPFDVSASDPETWEPFTDQVTREVIRKLRKVSGLRVVPPPSAFAFKSNKQREHIRDALPKVEYVLDGQISVTASGEVRISSELEALKSDGTLLWDGDFISRIDDTNIFVVQSEIALAVSQALQVAILDRESSHIVALPTNNLDAYRVYTRARNQQRIGTRVALEGSIALFDEAIELDSGFALAYAGKADTYRQLMTFFESPAEMLPHAIAAGTRALAFDPQSADVLATLGLSYLHALQWGDAFTFLGKSLERNPDVAQAYLGLALYYSGIGDMGLALDALERADDLDPLNVEIANFGVLALLNMREYERAIRWADQKSDLHGEVGWFLATASSPDSLVGNHARAIQRCERGARLNRENAVANLFLAQAYARAGREDDARDVLAKVSMMEGYVCPYESAAVHVALGEFDRAFHDLLERAIPNRSNCLMLTRQDPRLDPLREDPRFRALLARVGLDDDAVGLYQR